MNAVEIYRKRVAAAKSTTTKGQLKAALARVAELEAALEGIHAQAVNAIELGAQGQGFFEDVRDAAREPLLSR